LEIKKGFFNFETLLSFFSSLAHFPSRPKFLFFSILFTTRGPAILSLAQFSNVWAQANPIPNLDGNPG
jgi:hypothetical protein